MRVVSDKKCYDPAKEIMKVSESLMVFCEIVEWVCYVYFQLKSLMKFIHQKNLLKSTYFSIPRDIL